MAVSWRWDGRRTDLMFRDDGCIGTQTRCRRAACFFPPGGVNGSIREEHAMTIYERALEMVANESAIGLGSGRAAMAFVRLLGERVRAGRLNVRGLPTSEEPA